MHQIKPHISWVIDSNSTPGTGTPHTSYFNLSSNVKTYYGSDGIMRYSVGFFEKGHRLIHWHLEIGTGIKHSLPINSFIEFLFYFLTLR